MITVTRRRPIAAPPAAIFAVLSDPNGLRELLPRVSRVEFLARGDDHARIATYMDLAPFGELRSEGEVRWHADRELVFSSERPVPVEARWSLVPNGAGTDVTATLALDLARLIGPLAAFVPMEQVTNMVAPQLDAALAHVASRAEETCRNS
ncbi:MAG TPA: SRPBCC family protein [Roseiflexaceae bacterium]|jgi:carbon monoxide dehydrogenase subunit G|nr:SRPBCC family protein [Roseiflexaceae bacterium]